MDFEQVNRLVGIIEENERLLEENKRLNKEIKKCKDGHVDKLIIMKTWILFITLCLLLYISLTPDGGTMDFDTSTITNLGADSDMEYTDFGTGTTDVHCF